MSEELAQANHLLIEIARLRTDLEGTQHQLAEARAGLAAERRAREMAQSELDAAQAVVEVARAWIDWPGMNAAIADYDQAKKARGE